MSVDKPLLRYLLLSLFCLVIFAGAYFVLFPREPRPFYPRVPVVALGEVHFAPAEDLEQFDISLLDSATSKVDIAMYAFTDQRVADELLKLADRGVQIRLYRDGLQYSDETSRSQRGLSKSTTARLIGNPHIQIRENARSASMHLKAYCVDDSVLRFGSANWSRSGEQMQDNELLLLRDPAIIKRFESDFETIWNRSSNRSD